MKFITYTYYYEINCCLIRDFWVMTNYVSFTYKKMYNTFSWVVKLVIWYTVFNEPKKSKNLNNLKT